MRDRPPEHMTIRHSLLIVLLVLSYAPIPFPMSSASASSLTPGAASSQQRQSRKRVPQKKSHNPLKKAPLDGGGGGGSGGGTTTGGTTTGGTTTSGNARRRRRGRLRGRRGNRRQGRQRAGRQGGRKKAGKGQRGGQQAPPAPVETPIFVEARFKQEEGVPGTAPPQPLDVLAEDRPVHVDRHGRAPRQLLALDGHPQGGFAAAWLDRRDDSPQVYIGRFDQDGSSLEAERPAAMDSTPVAGFDADLDLGAEGRGTLFWSPPVESGSRMRLRSFESDGGFTAPERPTGPPRAGPAAAADSTLGPMRLARRSDGSAVIVSRHAGEIGLTELDPSGRQIGALATISKGRFEASGDPVVTTGPFGGVFVAWPTERGIATWTRAGVRDKPHQRFLGFEGAPLDLAFQVPTSRRLADDLGAWLLFEDSDGLRLLRVDQAFVPLSQPQTLTTVFDRAELATWGAGPAVLVETIAGDAIDSLRLHVMLPSGGPARAPVNVLPAGIAASRGARLAATTDRIMVAWTDAREGANDLYARVFESDRNLSSIQVRLTTDQHSASQGQPAVASNEAREQAVMAWTDWRDGVPRVYARRVAQSGELAPAELAVPAVRALPTGHDGLAACSQPVVAVDSAGRFLVVWKEQEAEHYLTRAQAFGADDRPLGPPFELDPGFDSSRVLAASVVALRQDGGWAVLWDRADEGVRLAHVATDGRIGIRHIELTRSPDVGSLALCLLDDSRLISVWSAAEEAPNGDGSEIQVRGRLLTLDLRTSGLEVELGVVSDFAGGLALARSRAGGFALTWTREVDTERDVMIGFFDRYGLPSAPPVVITPARGAQRDPSITRLANHSWVVAWQDDLSGTDLVHARRVRFDPIRLGPTFTVNQLAPARNEARRSPEIAALGDGLIATWIDARRSLGADVFARVLGPGFDGVIWSETGHN